MTKKPPSKGLRKGLRQVTEAKIRVKFMTAEVKMAAVRAGTLVLGLLPVVGLR